MRDGSESIMGDEIFPDEVMEIRVQMTKRYQETPGEATGDIHGDIMGKWDKNGIYIYGI